MLIPQKQNRTQSAGTKLTREQYSAIKTQAETQGLELSEYIRRSLLAAAQAETTNPLESLLLTHLEETLALRIIVLNLASAQASGELLTAERIQAVRAHADANKAARARTLLTESNNNNQSQLAASSETKEAA